MSLSFESCWPSGPGIDKFKWPRSKSGRPKQKIINSLTDEYFEIFQF